MNGRWYKVTNPDLVLPRLPPGPREVVYHFSEDPNIEVFRPRRSRPLPGHLEGRDLVWAIDQYHAPAYFFPRECPRIILWALGKSTDADIDRWMDGPGCLMAAFIEERWLPEFESCRLYRYSFDPAGFEDVRDGGGHVSADVVCPTSVKSVGPLTEALEAANVRLKAVESLQVFAGSIFSSLHFSGIRLRNSENWTPPNEKEWADRGFSTPTQ
jgi:hypothetical protein